MKTREHWIWLLIGMLLLGFIFMAFYVVLFYDDIYVTRTGWTWALVLLLSLFTNILWLISFALRLQVDKK